MRFTSLNEWLDWQQTLHWQDIELGLDRISQVATRLKLTHVAAQTIIVAGTNGKGSTVAYYSHFLQAAGYSVGCYSSPHLIKYNERISINAQFASDEQIMQAFDQIDQARQDISLSYFEFSTLAALLCIKEANVDVAVLEVGLGGRLDAVNIIDADLVHFTQIGIDHTAWLGDTRELIGFEKAGVLRQNCLAICNDQKPPQSLVNEIKKHSATALFIERDYHLKSDSNEFCYADLQMNLSSLSLMGEHQQLNCCGVLAGLNLLNHGSFFNQAKIQNAFKDVVFKARYETVDEDAASKTIIDVGHNVDAAKVLAQQIKKEGSKCNVLILGMLDDKDVGKFSEILANAFHHCICISLHGDRALSANELNAKINTKNMTKEMADDMSDALSKAQQYLSQPVLNQEEEFRQGIILVTGSFYTVETYLSQIDSEALNK